MSLELEKKNREAIGDPGKTASDTVKHLNVFTPLEGHNTIQCTFSFLLVWYRCRVCPEQLRGYQTTGHMHLNHLYFEINVHILLEMESEEGVEREEGAFPSVTQITSCLTA